MATTTFKDSRGREWCADFTVSGIKRVRAKLGHDLARLSDSEFKGYLDAVGHPVSLAETLFALCGHQHPDVSEDDFFDALAGDALHAAADAFQEGFLLFCPSHQRTALRALVAKSQAMTVAILAAVEAKAGETISLPDPSSTIVTASPD